MSARVRVTVRRCPGYDGMDDWAVFRSDQAEPVMTGLSRWDALFHKGQLEVTLDPIRLPEREAEE
jgi:hypothetical protein